MINIGAQDHHWLGNHYFADKGAEVLALTRTVETQKQHVGDHLIRLEKVLGVHSEIIIPFYASRLFNDDRNFFRLGEVDFELIWPGDGHFPGDAILWVPQEKTVFTGDLVFHDRMLGIHSFTPVVSWQKSFHKMELLNPLHIVPGHGQPGDLEKAKRDTGNYLDWLITEVSHAVDNWQELDETIEHLSEVSAFRNLKHYDDWHKRNINQTYVQMEAAR